MITTGQQVTGTITRNGAPVEFSGEVTVSTPKMVVVTDAAGTEWTALPKNVAAAKPAVPNLRTHTGAVHAPGRYFASIGGTAPKCCASANSVARYHFIVPTTDEVTCKKCMNLLAK